MIENAQITDFEKFYKTTKTQKKSDEKSKSNNFVWTDDEVELLPKVANEYKVSKTTETLIGSHASLALMFNNAILTCIHATKPDIKLNMKASLIQFVFAMLTIRVKNDVSVFQKFRFYRPHDNNKAAFSNFSTFTSVFKFIRFQRAKMPDTCGRNPYP